MNLFPLFVARRYSQPFRSKGMTGFLSMVSLLGLSLAVFALIVVMSVMNGFEKELQSRMLSLVPHAQVLLDKTLQPPDESSSANLVTYLESQPQVLAAAPYFEDVVILGKEDRIFSATLLGIDPELEKNMSELSEKMLAGDLLDLGSQRYGIIIGKGLSQHLDVFIGDKIDLTLPRVFVTPFGPVTRHKRFIVTGIFEVGSELDMNMVMVNRDDARRLLRRTAEADGIRLKLQNPYRSIEVMGALVPKLAKQEAFSNMSEVKWVDWREKNQALYNAVAMEKMVIFVLLLAVVAVATFNVVSIILMTATNKSGDIAILKTMGASTEQVRQLFMLQGSMIGVAGTFAGAALGVIVAPRVGILVSYLEELTGQMLFDPSIYYIPYLPSLLVWSDVFIVCCISIFLSILVTLLPAMRASRIAPVISLKEYI